MQTAASNIDDAGRLTDSSLETCRRFLLRASKNCSKTSNVRKRLETLIRELSKELEVLELRSQIHEQVQEQVSQNQREYLLREQMKAIQRHWAKSTIPNRKSTNCAKKSKKRK